MATTSAFMLRSEAAAEQWPATVLFDGSGQPDVHAVPGGQHLRLAPLPHGVVPA